MWQVYANQAGKLSSWCQAVYTNAPFWSYVNNGCQTRKCQRGNVRIRARHTVAQVCANCGHVSRRIRGCWWGVKCGEVYGGLRATSFLFFIYLFFNKGRFHGFCRLVSFIQGEERSLSSSLCFFLFFWFSFCWSVIVLVSAARWCNFNIFFNAHLLRCRWRI